jgi:hypothetical protein
MLTDGFSATKPPGKTTYSVETYGQSARLQFLLFNFVNYRAIFGSHFHFSVLGRKEQHEFLSYDNQPGAASHPGGRHHNQVCAREFYIGTATPQVLTRESSLDDQPQEKL